MSEEISVEEKARAQGWVPKEEYHGPEANWKGAEEFVEVGEKIGAVQAERNEKLLQEIKSLKQGMEQNMQDWNSMREQEMKAVRESSYARAVKDLKEKQIEAVESGDVEEFQKIESEIANVKKPEPIKTPQAAQPAEFIDWAAKNSWYNNDQELTAFADAYGASMQTQFEDPVKFYEAVGKQVKIAFPNKFEGTQQSNVPDVESPTGGSAPRTKGKHKFTDLPPEAKEACNKCIKDGLYKSREDYMEIFFGE